MASCFPIVSPVCHSIIILRDVLKMDMVSNFPSLITVLREIGVREAEQEKPQTSEKDENTPKIYFKNEKVTVHSPLLIQSSPLLRAGYRLGDTWGKGGR